MKKKKDQSSQLTKDELQKELKKKNSALERLKRKTRIDAEQYARESQNQLAMERVRARTMAMQKSDELPEAANLLFRQVQLLGMPAGSAGYCIWDEGKQAVTVWVSAEDVLMPSYKAPLTEDPSLIHMKEAYDRGETFFVEEIGGEEL